MIRAKLVVSGNVQGVGYRSLVRDEGRRLGLSGMVRNVQSGQVEVECEAQTPEKLDAFMKAIDRKGKGLLDINVTNIAVLMQDKVVTPKFTGFNIDFSMTPETFSKGSALSFTPPQKQMSAHAKKGAMSFAERMKQTAKQGPPKPQQTSYTPAMLPADKKKEKKDQGI